MPDGILSKKPYPTRKETLDWWVGTSSVVGPYRFVLHPNWPLRIAWAALFLAAVGLTIYQVALAVINYYGYPYNVLIEIQFSPTLVFPSITLCNLNPYRKQALKEVYPDLYNVINKATSAIVDGEYSSASSFDPTNDDVAPPADGDTPATEEPPPDTFPPDTAPDTTTVEDVATTSPGGPGGSGSGDYGPGGGGSGSGDYGPGGGGSGSGDYGPGGGGSGSGDYGPGGSGSGDSGSGGGGSGDYGPGGGGSGDYGSGGGGSGDYGPGGGGSGSVTDQPTTGGSGDTTPVVKLLEKSVQGPSTGTTKKTSQKRTASPGGGKLVTTAAANTTNPPTTTAATSTPPTTRRATTTVTSMPPTTSSSNVVVSALDAMDKAAARDWANKTDAVLYPNITSNNTPEYDLGFYVLERVQLLTDAQRARLGHTLNAMLVECYFIGQPCTPESFSTMINWRYGNCYTFNSGLGNVSLNLTTSRSGPDFGLSLVLLVESEQQVEQLAQSLGIRLTVQEQLRVPFPEDNGLSMSTGSYWGVSVTRQEVDRLGDPYYTCANSRDDVAQTDLYQAEFPTSEYSRETCEKSAIQAAIIKRCLCADATYPRPNGTEFCSRFNQTQLDCVAKVQLDFSAGIEAVDCPPSCEQVSYEKLLHTATWPSEAYWNILRRKVAARFPSRNISNNSLAWARDNLVKIDIYYKELNFERIYQQANYPVEKLLSDIGGVFGFWTGFCILSFFEVFELLGLLLLQSAFFHPKVFKSLDPDAKPEANNGAAPTAGSPAAANTTHEFPSQMPPGTEWPHGDAKSPAGWQPFSYNKW